MCGFVGLFAPDARPIRRTEVERMLRLLAHRGPDGNAVHIEKGFGVGFRRLAIIDLETGDQPLTNEDHQVLVVCNGEIYNYRSLVARLEKRGHVFRSRSDAEVIVHAYEEWGDDFVEHLRGIFALAIWDRRNRCVVLARDRSGVKPLHVTNHGGYVAFGSEAKALLALTGIKRELDLLGYAGPPEVDPMWERTCFQNVSQLGAGCLARVTETGIHAHRYWTYCPSERDGQPSPGIVQAFRDELEIVVAEQMMADVPLGAYLSGGLDSSALVSCLVRRGARHLQTFTTVAEGSDDARYAALLARALGVRANFIAHEDVLAGMIPFVAWMAEGEFDAGYLSRFQLAQAARERGIKVVLSGQGIDELLTGYVPSFHNYVGAHLQGAVAKQLRPSYRGMPPFGERALENIYASLGRSPRVPAATQLTVRALQKDHSNLSRHLLRFEDRMGMAASIEVRVPFLDHRLIELCASVPQTQRPNLFSRKSLLRRAARPWLPKAIVEREKFAFNGNMLPLSQLALAAPLPALHDLFSRRRIETAGYFSFEHVELLLERRQYSMLDHVLILQLLDELFVSRFDPSRWSVPPSVPSTSIESGNDPRVTRRRLAARPLCAEDVPRLSRGVVRASLDLSQPFAGGSIDMAVIHFAEAIRAPLAIPVDALEILRLVDGRRSYAQILEQLGGRLELRDLISFGQSMTREGVFVPSERATTPSTGQAPRVRVPKSARLLATRG